MVRRQHPTGFYQLDAFTVACRNPRALCSIRVPGNVSIISQLQYAHILYDAMLHNRVCMPQASEHSCLVTDAERWRIVEDEVTVI